MIIVVLVASMLATLLVRLYYVQLLDPHKPVQTAGQLHDGDIVIPAPRGLIVDDRGRPLVQNTAAQEITVIKKDVFSFLKGSFPQGFDVILIDPPFTESLADDVLQALALSEIARFPAKIFIEAGKRETLAPSYGTIQLIEKKDYGDKHLGIYRMSPSEAAKE